MTAATAVLLAGSVLVAFRFIRPAPQRGGRARAAAQLPIHPTEGGTRVANARRRLWARNRPALPADETQEQISAEDRGSSSTIERLSAYSITPSERPVDEGRPEALAEQGDGEEAGPAEADVQPDLVAVGEEVSMVLKSAEQAAEKIRRTARQEAEQLLSVARDSAAADVAEARRIAGADRADGNRIRAEAEMYAKDTCATADAFAETRRTEAEREARQIMTEAEERLAAANAEVEQRVREAEAEARYGVEVLQREAQRHEERLESILVVFRSMTSQLEELIGRRAERDAAAETSDEEFDDALRPEPSSTWVP